MITEDRSVFHVELYSVLYSRGIIGLALLTAPSQILRAESISYTHPVGQVPEIPLIQQHR